MTTATNTATATAAQPNQTLDQASAQNAAAIKTPLALDLTAAPAPVAPQAVAQHPLPSGFDRAKLQRDIAQTGEFTAASVAAMRATGWTEEAISDAQQVYRAAAQLATNEVLTALGGKESFEQIRSWAHGPSGIPREQMLKLNEQIQSTDPVVRELATKSLRSMYESATNERIGARPAPTLEGGAVNTKADPNPLPLIRNPADMTALERDPRYSPTHPESTAFRALVNDRLAEYHRWRTRANG
jgi:hypothetical protein